MKLAPWSKSVLLPGGRETTIDFKSNSRAKRFILRRAPRTGRATVTVPAGANKQEAEAFVYRNLDWIAEQLGSDLTQSAKPLTYGDQVPWNGEFVEISMGKTVELAGDKILVPLQRDITRAVLDLLGTWARRDMAQRVETYRQALGAQRNGPWVINKLRITDTTTRWGSCSSRGVISLNKRLMMAPEWIRNYVCAHEVAHLAEPNHSANFWALCQALEPNVAPNDARDFLRANGPNYFTAIPK